MISAEYEDVIYITIVIGTCIMESDLSSYVS